jgi:tyrosyl-tRNA synthetase
MEAYGLEPQVVITYPLLIGLDGEDKMSKSKENYVAISEPPEEMFGKVMSISDELLPQWWEITLRQREPKLEPMGSKLALARGIVAKWHDDAAARRAEEHFTRVVRRHEAPADVEEQALPAGDPIHLPALLADGMGIPSTSEARRLITQGAVKIDGEVVTELDVPRARLDGAVVQAGKRRFRRFHTA